MYSAGDDDVQHVKVKVHSAGKAGIGSQVDCLKRKHPFYRICNRYFIPCKRPIIGTE